MPSKKYNVYRVTEYGIVDQHGKPTKLNGNFYIIEPNGRGYNAFVTTFPGLNLPIVPYNGSNVVYNVLPIGTRLENNEKNYKLFDIF